MKSKLFGWFFVIGILIVIFPAVIFAYPQVLGSKDAKGQVKKQTVEVTVGTIGEVNQGKIQVNNNNKKTQINTDQNTKIIEKPSNKKLNFGQLKKDDKIAAIASASASASESAKLIIVKEGTASATAKQNRKAIYGLVREITGDIIVVSHPLKDNPRYRIRVVAGTYIKIKGLASATIADIRVGDRLAAVGEWADDALVVKKIHVIPGKAVGLMERVATKSATASASPATSSANF